MKLQFLCIEVMVQFFFCFLMRNFLYLVWQRIQQILFMFFMMKMFLLFRMDVMFVKSFMVLKGLKCGIVQFQRIVMLCLFMSFVIFFVLFWMRLSLGFILVILSYFLVSLRLFFLVLRIVRSFVFVVFVRVMFVILVLVQMFRILFFFGSLLEIDLKNFFIFLNFFCVFLFVGFICQFRY